MVSHDARHVPWTSKASRAYDEHVGKNRQGEGRPSAARWYQSIMATATRRPPRSGTAVCTGDGSAVMSRAIGVQRGDGRPRGPDRRTIVRSHCVKTSSCSCAVRSPCPCSFSRRTPTLCSCWSAVDHSRWYRIRTLRAPDRERAGVPADVDASDCGALRFPSSAELRNPRTAARSADRGGTNTTTSRRVTVLRAAAL